MSQSKIIISRFAVNEQATSSAPVLTMNGFILVFLLQSSRHAASHSFNMFDPVRDYDCQQCHSYIKLTAPCRLSWYGGRKGETFGQVGSMYRGRHFGR
ncbi:hypothetical protein CR513_52501, partial [Mucuna pruriens]